MTKRREKIVWISIEMDGEGKVDGYEDATTSPQSDMHVGLRET